MKKSWISAFYPRVFFCVSLVLIFVGGTSSLRASPDAARERLPNGSGCVNAGEDIYVRAAELAKKVAQYQDSGSSHKGLLQGQFSVGEKYTISKVRYTTVGMLQLRVTNGRGHTFEIIDRIRSRRATSSFGLGHTIFTFGLDGHDHLIYTGSQPIHIRDLNQKNRRGLEDLYEKIVTELVRHLEQKLKSTKNEKNRVVEELLQ